MKLVSTSGVNGATEEYEPQKDIDRCPLCGIALQTYIYCISKIQDFSQGVIYSILFSIASVALFRINACVILIWTERPARRNALAVILAPTKSILTSPPMFFFAWAGPSYMPRRFCDGAFHFMFSHFISLLVPAKDIQSVLSDLVFFHCG